MLKELQELPRDLKLVAHSGVQLLDYGFRLPEEFSFTRMFLEQRAKDEDNEEIDVLRQIETDRKGLGYRDVETGAPVTETSTYSVQFAKALQVFDTVWLPAPFLKQKGYDEVIRDRETFEQGPSNWARIRVAKVDADPATDYNYRVTIAFETRPGEVREGWPYVCPVSEDVRNEARFMLASEIRDISWFLKEPWVTGWLKDELEAAETSGRARKITRNDQQRAQCAYWAYYVTLLQGLKALLVKPTGSASLPRIQFINTLSQGAARQAVEVDLVLDIGNSRTCGILIETGMTEGLKIENAAVLELRDLSRPELAYQDPFRSHVEFAPAEFGNVYRTTEGGGRGMFKWPSLVRVGPEALRLYDKNSGAEGDTGLSGPKRYIWDERENWQPWRFNVSEFRNREAMNVYGDLTLLLSQDGNLLKNSGPNARRALSPKFSRASLFTFMVMEIVLQAVVQINSAGYRASKAHSSVHRRIRRILFTIPTATPLTEMRKYKSRCEDAVTLLWDAFDWTSATPGVSPAPQVNIAYDEATCTQIVYLYSEIVQKLQRSPSDLFKLLNQSPYRPSPNMLRIASLDIGGGTTDLMIVSYAIDPPNNALLPTQDFREGFRRAGDDILEAVISQHVLKAIESALADQGVREPKHLLREFMLDARKDTLQKKLRKLFVSRILVPIALHLLSQYETANMFGEERDPVTFGTILGDNVTTLERVIEFFERPAIEAGAGQFSLLKVEISLNAEGLGNTITSVMGDIISLMCEVVHRFDCDVLLLTGRPSRFPIIRDLILRYLPIPPHRLIFMHEYTVDKWYPFASRLGKIDDPKTTVVVGALICAFAEDLKLPGFPLQRGGFTIRSTAKYIGELHGNDTLPKENVIFSQDSKAVSIESKKLTFNAPMFIGFRQLDLERWPGTPLFYLSIAEDDGDAARHAFTMPWAVTLQRREPSPDDPAAKRDLDLETFSVSQIIDREGNDLPTTLIRSRLQTMRNLEGYWLDTGTVTVAD